MPNDTNAYLTLKETAKAVRAFLKERGIKPKSVICSRGTGPSVNVYVQKKDYSVELYRELEQFAWGRFDCMNDSYNAKPDHTIEWPPGVKVSPGAKFVFLNVVSEHPV